MLERVITALELRAGDLLCEPIAGHKIRKTPIKKVEHRACGVHVNDSMCFNAPETELVVAR